MDDTGERRIAAWLDRGKTAYQPGELLAGGWRLVGTPDPGDVRGVEVTIGWYTEGKGDDDSAAHLTTTMTAAECEADDFTRDHRFETVLPPTPQSYRGLLFSIRWRVRVRVKTRHGTIESDLPFKLGEVTPAREASTA